MTEEDSLLAPLILSKVYYIVVTCMLVLLFDELLSSKEDWDSVNRQIKLECNFEYSKKLDESIPKARVIMNISAVYKASIYHVLSKLLANCVHHLIYKNAIIFYLY